MPSRPPAAAGVYTFADGRRYEGEYRNNMKNGHGVYTWADGIRFDGQVGRIRSRAGVFRESFASRVRCVRPPPLTSRGASTAPHFPVGGGAPAVAPRRAPPWPRLCRLSHLARAFSLALGPCFLPFPHSTPPPPNPKPQSPPSATATNQRKHRPSKRRGKRHGRRGAGGHATSTPLPAARSRCWGSPEGVLLLLGGGGGGEGGQRVDGKPTQIMTRKLRGYCFNTGQLFSPFGHSPVVAGMGAGGGARSGWTASRRAGRCTSPTGPARTGCGRGPT